MARAATFVSVVTTDGEGGRHGVTVSSMTSVSADGPAPSLLICVHHQSPAATAILQNRAFCANLLAQDQQHCSDIFSGRRNLTGQGRFDAVDWVPGVAGQPVLTRASAAFQCDLRTALLWETHYVIIGAVSVVDLSDSTDALLYGQRGYRRAIEL